MTYRHLSVDERTRIDCLLQAGTLLRQIALQLKRSVSTLYRELARNGKGRTYHAAHTPRPGVAPAWPMRIPVLPPPSGSKRVAI